MTLAPSDPADGGGAAAVRQLANSVPQRQQLGVVCAGLLDHVGNRDHSYSSQLPAVRTLDILTYHDYGFYHVKQ